MTSCCNSSDTKHALCPANGKRYKQVKRKTILHQISRPWDKALPDQNYYYCSDPECDVIYFGENKQIITSDEMRDSSQLNRNNICHCFDISKQDLQQHENLCKAFVIEQTRNGVCDCEIRNPSGKCCLKDFN